MKQLILIMLTTFMLFLPNEKINQNTIWTELDHTTKVVNSITPMQALDLVKDKYADNFEKVFSDKVHDTDGYYYKLPFADYYLVYEEEIGNKHEYLIHLYEFVVDDPDTGVGHTVTYGWYAVDKYTGMIMEQND